MRTDSFAPPGTPLSVRLGPNPRGRDLVVGDVHGHFATLRRALADLEFGNGDRLFSLGDLIDRGPDCFEAKAWIEARDPSTRFDLVVRGNHEQMMLEALKSSPLPPFRKLRATTSAWGLWQANGGRWWYVRSPEDSAHAWIEVLASLPFAARIETPHGPVGLVHACPVHRSWERLEKTLEGDAPINRFTRMRALWSRIYHGMLQPEIGERGAEYDGPVRGVRSVLTGHTPLPAPVWRENVLAIDTGIARPDLGQLTLARIDMPEIETWSFDRV